MEICPHCDGLVNVYAEFAGGGDYSCNFEMECPKCEKVFDVEVETVPEFHLTKKE